jgi:hypothetical protein
MSVKVRDEKGEVREFTFVIQSAVELFLASLPPGWEVID